MRTNYILQKKYILIRLTRLLYMLLLAIIPLSGQNPSYQLPTIIRPSPTAQNFMRYGEIPVDYSTGVPRIEIPVYIFEGKKISLPISISYHASGIKVHDVASEVGIGWVLNAGGIITRTMMDTYDEVGWTNKTYASADQLILGLKNTFYNNFDSSSMSYPGVLDVESYLNTKYNGEDLMSDRYFYNMPNGIAGIFRYAYPQNSTLIMLPYRPYKINRSQTAISDDFNIIDDKGIKYHYKRFNDSNYGSSEWFLVEMYSADDSEYIKLNYISQNATSTGKPVSTWNTAKHFLNGSNPCDPGQVEHFPHESNSGTGGVTYNVALASIENEDIIVNFIYSTREDFQYASKISEINVLSKGIQNIIKKKITFNHSYFGNVGYENLENSNKRLKLNAVTIFGENGTEAQNYSFAYDESNILPPYRSRSTDFWGYYNGGNSGTAIPENMIPQDYQGQNYGINRKADNGFFSKAASLKEIKYPSGGRTKFEYERAFVDNLYNGPNSSGYIGGLRVLNIVNYSKDNEIASMKSYQYNNPVFNKIDSEFYSYIQRYIDHYSYEHPILDSGPESCYVYYDRTFVTSEPIVGHDLLPGLPLAYSNVTEYDGTANSNTGFTEYHYSVPNYLQYTGNLRDLHTYQNDYGNYSPKLTFKAIKSSDGKRIVEETNFYSNHYEKEFKTGINVVRKLDYLLNKSFPTISQSSQILPFNVNDYLQSIQAFDTKAYQNANLLDYTVKRTYDRQSQDRYVDERSDYNYNQHNLMINEVLTVNSSGHNTKRKYKYPFDFSSLQPYQTMLNKNILTPVIEQIVSNTTLSKQIQKIQTSYKDWGNNIIEPEIIKGQMDAASPLENRIRYLSYDSKANPLTVKKEVGNPLTYLWGYNKSLPIAAVENAKYASETINNDLNVSYSGLQIPMGTINQELGTFTITEEKDYKIDRIYERYPENHSVMYQTSFQNINNSSGSVSFTDITPASGNFHTYTSPSVHLKPGTYKVKLTNVGYNGYQGQIENNFNFTVYNPVEASVPFHTSFEEESVNVSTAYAMTGKSSHTGDYVVNLPSGNLGYDKVIVSYWGKASASSPWQYIENIVTLGSMQNYLIGTNYAYIDEVRLYPVDARMKTYTYDPFYKTQTSIMNENGQTEYYDYDASGRLKEVYMIEGNVKKTIRTTNYHYKP
ncbi:hypothetical protein [uncultured Chryseobacterium sp.]|uniref:hypothetical protein n=1 Tax=uncultured Chryseobacterium sp. TaxID=259322 RepID=UPI0025D79612|nr:hypothetical protein [uncultured Chryseobacterium sp.]